MFNGFFKFTNRPEYISGFNFELLVHKIIKDNENINIIEICNNADYDFKDNNNITYEIKNDSRSIKTGNFFITFKQKFVNKNNYQLAGISVTKSDYYILRYGNKIYKIKTDILKEIINNNFYNIVDYKNNRGDNIGGYLVPAVDIVTHCVIYDIN